MVHKRLRVKGVSANGEILPEPAQKVGDTQLHNQCTCACTISTKLPAHMANQKIPLVLCPSMVDPYTGLPDIAAGQYQACSFAAGRDHGFEQMCPCVVCCDRRVSQGWPLVPTNWGLYAKEPLLHLKPFCLCHGGAAVHCNAVGLTEDSVAVQAAVEKEAGSLVTIAVQTDVNLRDIEAADGMQVDVSDSEESPTLPSYAAAAKLPKAEIASKPTKSSKRRKRRKQLEADRKKPPLQPFPVE